MLDIMLDLETLGNGPRAAIRAIGAVSFDMNGVDDDCVFYAKVNLNTCVAAGLELDPDTVLWWLAQGEAARAEMCRGEGMPLNEALDYFEAFVAGRQVRVWGNGAAFDNTILASAYRALGRPTPWKFYNDRCYRTMKSMHPHVTMPRSGTHHNALDDAKSQAAHLIQIWASGQGLVAELRRQLGEEQQKVDLLRTEMEGLRK